MQHKTIIIEICAYCLEKRKYAHENPVEANGVFVVE